MNKKDLEKLGLTEEALEKAGIGKEALEKIIILHGQDIESIKNTNTTLTTENGTLKTQLAEAGTTIEGFKKMKPEELQQAVENYKKAAETAKTEADAAINSLKFDFALETALRDAHARNPKAVRALLETKDLKVGADGKIVGLNEQLEKVMAENDFLFEQQVSEEETSGEESDDQNPPEKKYKITTKTNSQSVLGNKAEQAARKAAGLPISTGDK